MSLRVYMLYKIQALIYRKSELTAINLLRELYLFIQNLPAWSEKSSKWLIANPTSKLIAIENNMMTQDAIDFINIAINLNEDISIFLADENEDDSIITIYYKNTPTISNERYLLSVTIKHLSNYNDVDSFIYIFDKMIKYNGWAFKYILLDTEQYRFNQREVFDDRLPVGWMLYLPLKITREDTPSAYKLFDVDNDIGTIVVSKDEFNGKDQTDIACANNVEMELAANGLLPLIKGM